MRPAGNATLALVVAATALLATPVAATGRVVPNEHTRLYLLAAPTDYLYYGVDPDDPELAVPAISRTCPDLPWGPGTKPCSSLPAGVGTAERVHQVLFLPASRLETAIPSKQPLRYRLALRVASPAAYTVHVFRQGAGGLVESAPAKETAPGVWEGSFSMGGLLAPGAPDALGVRIRSQAPRLTFELGTAGQSWIELPTPVHANSVPRLRAQSPDASAPLTYTTAHRSFAFNDTGWRVSVFEGDLQQERSYAVTLPSRTAVVYGWVEVFDTPFAHDLAGGQPPDPRKLTTVPEVALRRGEEQLGHGANVGRVAEYATGRGMDTVVAMDVAPGPLTLHVGPLNGAASTMTYRAYLLEVVGERTLQRLRWRFHPTEFEPVVHQRNAILGACPPMSERVPVTPAVSTFAAAVGWDNAGAAAAKWTLAFDLPQVGRMGCGEMGTGAQVRFTYAAPPVTVLGIAPTRDAAFASYRDTVFTMSVRYSYRPEVSTSG